MNNLPVPVELTDVELDAVSAGQNQIGNGLVVVAVQATDVASHNDIDVTLSNIANNNLNNNNVGVGVAVAAGILAPAGAGNFQRIG
jgi:hypothetical protein